MGLQNRIANTSFIYQKKQRMYNKPYKEFIFVSVCAADCFSDISSLFKNNIKSQLCKSSNVSFFSG